MNVKKIEIKSCLTLGPYEELVGDRIRWMELNSMNNFTSSKERCITLVQFSRILSELKNLLEF